VKAQACIVQDLLKLYHEKTYILVDKVKHLRIHQSLRAVSILAANASQRRTFSAMPRLI
jgi:hypothetical protein